MSSIGHPIAPRFENEHMPVAQATPRLYCRMKEHDAAVANHVRWNLSSNIVYAYTQMGFPRVSVAALRGVSLSQPLGTS